MTTTRNLNMRPRSCSFHCPARVRVLMPRLLELVPYLRGALAILRLGFLLVRHSLARGKDDSRVRDLPAPRLAAPSAEMLIEFLEELIESSRLSQLLPRTARSLSHPASYRRDRA